MDMSIWCLYTAFNTAVCIYHTGRCNAHDQREKGKTNPAIKPAYKSHCYNIISAYESNQ